MNRICIKAKVSGRVQGVGFRYHTAYQGLTLSVNGYAKNEDDGSVTVLACGERAQVEKLITWLEQGPRSANVTSLQHQELEWQSMDGFKIL